ncbi:hypothetical protein Cs7R123_62540 [Catellatospora sp. TT07R-123]|uniref:hypothetical protein n=1 Tax=Catellatospora sp. TT07R-123 TaxID=2733863 RepID=UPI001B0BFCF6|nr:hypothetical protein [Catellatospora sp. TT07R-123]GHJ48912.1 hypothetical protein Cs7R123_62540 [Catellatospora sp. TT07R-123]
MNIYFPRPKALLRALLIAVLVLHAVSLGSHFVYHYLGWHNIVPYFGKLTGFVNVDKEANIPTWFSSLLLFGCAYVAWAVYRHVRRTQGRYRRHWAVLSAIFAALSMDELAHMHELAGRFGLAGHGGASYLSWVVAITPFVLGFAVAYLRFLLHLPARIRTLVTWSGVLYVGGAAGMEVAGALLGRDLSVHLEPGKPYFHYLLYASAEEALEMVGAVLFLYAMTLHLRTLTRTETAPPAMPAPARPADVREAGAHAAHRRPASPGRPSPARTGRPTRR